MTVGRILCRTGWHRWQRTRLLTDIKLLGTARQAANVSFKVNDAHWVDCCARCPARRPARDTP